MLEQQTAGMRVDLLWAACERELAISWPSPFAQERAHSTLILVVHVRKATQWLVRR